MLLAWMRHMICASGARRNTMTDNKRNESDNAISGRSFAGASYGANEREQTRDLERARRPQADEAGEFVTDAETDARQGNEEIGDEKK
jgi:hypothetical protein